MNPNPPDWTEERRKRLCGAADGSASYIGDDITAALAEIDRLTARVEAQRDVMLLALAFIEPISNQMWVDGAPNALGVAALVESLTKHTAVPPPAEGK